MEKDKSKKMKRDALKSFLEASSSPAPTTDSNLSEEPSRIVSQEPQDCEQVFLEENNNCVVCSCELLKAKIKKCGFCGMPACSEHLRKRRRKKGKFQKVCDTCEDRIIYEIYTKLEAKAEQSINVQQEIVTLKHDNYLEEVEQKRQKRRQIGFKTMKLQQTYEQKDKQLTDEQNLLMSQQHKVESNQLSAVQLEAYVTRVQTSFKQNHEHDFNLLSEENSRLGKELAKIEKKCQEIKLSMNKKQKQIEDAFSQWQQRQFQKKLMKEQKNMSKKQKDCIIY